MIGRFIKSVVTLISKTHKDNFLALWNPKWTNDITSEIPIHIISLSGKKQVVDQLYSLTSFYMNCGVPSRWIIYDDGTMEKEDIQIFKSIKNVEIRNVCLLESRLPKSVLKRFPTLNKVELFRIHQHETPAVFVDSDIVFYKQYSKFINELIDNNWFLTDENKGYFDDEYYLGRSTSYAPLNLGFILINRPVSIENIYTYIEGKLADGSLGYWSDQTAFDRMAIENNFTPLSSNYFVTGGNDSFTFQHCVDYNKIALRHFVGPVRHKMWQYPWKKVLAVKV